MNSSTRFAEHWTVTGERIVLSGSEQSIRTIALDLDVPLENMVKLSKTEYALPLWGNALHRYVSNYSSRIHVSSVPRATDAVISTGVV